MVLFSVTLRNPCFPGTAVVGMPCRFHGSAGLFTVFWKGLLGSSPGVSAGQEGVLSRVMMGRDAGDRVLHACVPERAGGLQGGSPKAGRRQRSDGKVMVASNRDRPNRTKHAKFELC